MASDCTLDNSVPACPNSSSLSPSSPNNWPSSLLSSSRVASPELDTKESTTSGLDWILVLDHDMSTSTDDWKRIDLGNNHDLILICISPLRDTCYTV